MEVVILEQFGPAVFGNFGVNGSAAKFVLNGFETGFRFVESLGYRASAEFAVLAISETGA